MLTLLLWRSVRASFHCLPNDYRAASHMLLSATLCFSAVRLLLARYRSSISAQLQVGVDHFICQYQQRSPASRPALEVGLHVVSYPPGLLNIANVLDRLV
jgi:hypothetical protein